MATFLSPEEQVMSSVGASGVEPSGGFDLTGALQDGYTPSQIADELAKRKGFNISGARQDGYRDDQIISHLMGETAFTGAMQRFIQAGGSSIKGIIDLAGGLDKDRALAERTAAQVASSNFPVAGMVGELTGAIADPITAPAFALKGLKAATLVGTMAKQGAVQGGVSGALEPVLTPEESRLLNTVTGTAVGTVFGAGLGKASQEVINFLEKRAIKAADAETTKAAIDDVAKSVDNPPSKQEAEAQAVNYDIPAYLRRAEAEGTPAPPVREPLDPVQVKLVEDRVVKTEAEITKLETDLANVQKQQPEKEVGDLLGLKEPTKVPTEKQVAALFKAPEGENLPAKFGLVAPTPEAPAKQVAALFKSAAPSEVPVIKQQIVEAAKQGTAQEYLLRQIEAKKLEVERLKGMIAPPAKEFPIQVETRLGPTPQQVAARDAGVQQMLERTGRAEPMPQEAPRMAQEDQQKIQKESESPIVGTMTVNVNGKESKKIRRKDGSVEIDGVQVVAPTEVPVAPSRGFQSGGAAATPRELLFAESVPFDTNAEKLLTGGQKRGANVEPVSANEQWNDLFSKAVGVLGAIGRQLRGRGEFGGSLEGTQKAGEKAAARMRREEGSEEEWVFKQDEQGNYPNIDKSWNRAEIEAFRPVYEEARATLSANLDEINRLRDAGELTDAALQNLTYRSQLPIGIIGIYQGQRTKASDALNAFKLAKSQFEAGKEIKGLFQPGVDCK